jgi:hypothetical protein
MPANAPAGVAIGPAYSSSQLIFVDTRTWSSRQVCFCTRRQLGFLYEVKCAFVLHRVTKFAVKSLEDRPNYAAPTIDLFYNVANCIFRFEEVLLADGRTRLDTVETLRGFYE